MLVFMFIFESKIHVSRHVSLLYLHVNLHA